MGKGEIAHYEQFVLFPHCFQKACFPGASKDVIVWEWAKREIIITSLFRKLTKVWTNNVKIDLNRISDLLKMCKNIISA